MASAEPRPTAAVSTYGRAVVRGARKVFLVHGAGMDQSIWTLQGRFLAFHGWNAFAVDLPGHGRVRNQSPLESIEAIADWLAELVASTGPEPAVVIGHSMGALAALDLAARHPGRVERLVLLGAAAQMPVHPELLALARDGDPRAVDLICDWGFGSRAHLGGSALPGAWLLGSARTLLLRGDPRVLAADLAACHGYRAGEERATRVGCPALVMIGAEDRMTPPRAGTRLAGLLAHGSSVVLDGVGHMMMVEDPEATLAALKRFLA
ncbi:MAG: alpha/beta hydrolase [Geminicoccaceae bacterium]|nr:alpha/beta hydrolase [Geminicoccaceae bacterium]MCX7629735.1 alpha/beta hydrolase [Geminicoccaceae bacterium]MDW8371217.1 alpha/beta hydrolase [Geminicoccaceae bacterium]